MSRYVKAELAYLHDNIDSCPFILDILKFIQDMKFWRRDAKENLHQLS